MAVGQIATHAPLARPPSVGTVVDIHRDIYHHYYLYIALHSLIDRVGRILVSVDLSRQESCAYLILWAHKERKVDSSE